MQERNPLSQPTKYLQHMIAILSFAVRHPVVVARWLWGSSRRRNVADSLRQITAIPACRNLADSLRRVAVYGWQHIQRWAPKATRLAARLLSITIRHGAASAVLLYTLANLVLLLAGILIVATFVALLSEPIDNPMNTLFFFIVLPLVILYLAAVAVVLGGAFASFVLAVIFFPSTLLGEFICHRYKLPALAGLMITYLAFVLLGACAVVLSNISSSFSLYQHAEACGFWLAILGPALLAYWCISQFPAVATDAGRWVLHIIRRRLPMRRQRSARLHR